MTWPPVPPVSPPAGEAKRPIGPSSFTSADGGTIICERPAQRPRLDVAANSPKFEHETEHKRTTGEPASSIHVVGANLDLLIHITSFMLPDNTLYNVCIALGPSIAAHIRHKYLLSNETYLIASLRPLFNEDIRGRYWLGYSKHRETFDKCGRNVEAWMKVNNNWRSRCTNYKMKRYRQAKCAEEGGELVFNNPLVALVSLRIHP